MNHKLIPLVTGMPVLIAYFLVGWAVSAYTGDYGVLQAFGLAFVFLGGSLAIIFGGALYITVASAWYERAERKASDAERKHEGSRNV